MATTEDMNKTGESDPVAEAAGVPVVMAAEATLAEVTPVEVAEVAGAEVAGEEVAGEGETTAPSKPKEAKNGKYGERKDSAAWVYVHWELVEGQENENVAENKKKWRCKYCKNAQYRHNVTRMRNHLIQCSLTPQYIRDTARKSSEKIEERKSKKQKTKRADDGDKAEVSSKKRSAEDAAKGQDSNKKAAIDTTDLNNEFAKAICSMGLSPSAVENEKLKKFVNKLCPEYDYPSEADIDTCWKLLKLSCEADTNANAAVAVAPPPPPVVESFENHTPQ